MYRELEKQMYTRTPDGRLFTTTTNLTNHLRMLQLASSSVEIITTVDENGEPHDDIRLVEPSSKLDVFDELLLDFEGEQVVVSALSRQLIEMAAARLTKRGERFGLITGRIGEIDRRANLDDFQAGRTRILLFTVKAGGVGIDMTAAGTMIRLQRSYSMIDNVQGLGRIDRIGAEHHDMLHIVDVIAPDTVEVEQLDKIREKEDRLETITRDGLTHDDEYAAIMSSSLLPPLWEETQ
jgi:SNF2 family DNA or RNA helicase